MRIKEIEERIKSSYTEEELKEFSSFVLAEYAGSYISDPILVEVVPIENESSNIVIVDDNVVLADINGNTLDTKIDAKEENDNDLRRIRIKFSNNKYEIIYAKENKIVLSESIRRWQLFEQESVLNDLYVAENKKGKLKIIDHLFYNDADKAINVEVASHDKGLLVVSKVNRDDEKSAFLYSVPEGRIISPMFESLENVNNKYKDKVVFKYTDVITSNELLDGKPYQSRIIGFIDDKGKIYNEYFDENKNYSRKMEMHDNKKLSDYSKLKTDLAVELDKEVGYIKAARESKDASIKILEISAILKK